MTCCTVIGCDLMLIGMICVCGVIPASYWQVVAFQFPLCDGSHTKHNMDTGDNVGPLVLRRMDVSEQ